MTSSPPFSSPRTKLSAFSLESLVPSQLLTRQNSATDTPYNSERTLRQQHSNSSLPDYSPLYERSNTDLSTRKSIDTLASSSSTGSNIEKLKKGWNRMRRKPVPGSFHGSVRRHPAAEVEPTRIKRGVWKDQLLIDRSLRGMAALTALFALGIFIIIAAHIQPFANRANMYTSSIGGKTRSCNDEYGSTTFDQRSGDHDPRHEQHISTACYVFDNRRFEEHAAEIRRFKSWDEFAFQYQPQERRQEEIVASLVASHHNKFTRAFSS